MIGWWKRRAARRAGAAAQAAKAEEDRVAKERRLAADRDAALAASRAEEETKARLRAAEVAYQQWVEEDEHLRSLIETASTYEGFDDHPAVTLQLQPGERCLFVVSEAKLIEPRKQRGTYVGGRPGYTIPGVRPHYVGGHAGLSYRVAPRLRISTGRSYGHLVGGTASVRIPGTRATYVPGEEMLTPIDSGTATTTDRRVVFQGEKQAREWPFSKLLGFDNQGTWTSLQSSNRQKVSGIGYGPECAPQWEFFLALALARFHGSVDELIAHLRAEREAHQSGRALLAAARGEDAAPTQDQTAMERDGEHKVAAGNEASALGGQESWPAPTTPPEPPVADARRHGAPPRPDQDDGWWKAERVAELVSRVSPRARDALGFIAGRAPEVPFDDVLTHLGLDGRGTAAVMKSVGTALREMDAPQILERDYDRRMYRIGLGPASILAREVRQLDDNSGS